MGWINSIFNKMSFTMRKQYCVNSIYRKKNTYTARDIQPKKLKKLNVLYMCIFAIILTTFLSS